MGVACSFLSFTINYNVGLVICHPEMTVWSFKEASCAAVI